MSKEIKRAVCPYDCPTTCGFFVETDGGRIVRVIGDENDPASKGLLCRKMRNYERSVNSDKKWRKGRRPIYRDDMGQGHKAYQRQMERDNREGRSGGSGIL